VGPHIRLLDSAQKGAITPAKTAFPHLIRPFQNESMLSKRNAGLAENTAIRQQSCGIAICFLERRTRWREAVRDRHSEECPIVSPVMNRCSYYSRGARLRHCDVGGANGSSQSTWRMELLAPTPPGAGTACPAGVSRQSSIALI